MNGMKRDIDKILTKISNHFLRRESGCNPFATSILADIFGEELRASAISVYNWGIYIGYSLAYAVGNSLLIALVGRQN